MVFGKSSTPQLPTILPEVIIVTEARMPAGDATAHRMSAVASGLAETGLRVAILGRGDESSQLPVAMADTVSYHLWYAGRSPVERLNCAIEHCLGRWVIDRLKTLAGRETRVIICTQGGIPFLHRLFALGRSLHVPVVVDVTEWWWVPHWCRQFSNLPLLLEHVLRNRYIYPRPKRLIAISQSLGEFYRVRGCRVFRLPPILDLREEKWRVESLPPQDGALHVIFAGTPERERWDVILEGLAEANDRGIPVILEVLGVPRDRFEQKLDVYCHLLDRCRDRLVFHGRVPPEQVKPIMARAHLGILVRDDAPWSRGCFPSKVPEFLALGVPVIFNPNSDLDDYLQEGVEGIRIDRPTVQCLVDGLARAWTLMKNGHWGDLRHSARRRAQNSFVFNAYANSLRDFLGL